MPRENKIRGRHAEAKKRKLEQQDGFVDGLPHKKSRNDDVYTEDATANGYDETFPETNGYVDTNGYTEDGDGYQEGGSDRPFYGLLDEQEQEYFRKADELLETTQFETPEDRSLFLENVFKEAQGKELKMACSQSCSRLLEKLIKSASADQLKKLFQSFNGHFLHLVQHRFASHCCETLFIQSAPLVTRELASVSGDENPSTDSEPIATLENLFLFAINELQGNLGFLLTDKFGSHVLRVLLVIFSGQSVDQSSAASLLRSKRKEHVEVGGINGENHINNNEKHAVPQSFTTALETMMHESVAGLDTSYLRTLATHQIGNPMLQLLLHLDLSHYGKHHAKDQTSVIHKLLPDETLQEGTDSANFINGLVFDPVGSRLVETFIQDAPGKLFKSLYRDYFRDRIGSLSRNEVAGYVVGKLLERLSKDDLQKARDDIIPQVPNLAERGRTAIIKTLIERCVARHVDTAPLAAALQKAYTEDEGATFSILRMLNIANPVEPNLQTSPTRSTSSADAAFAAASSQSPSHPSSSAPEVLPPLDHPEKPLPTINTTASTLHASLLLQTMLKQTGLLSTMAFDAISKLPPNLILSFARTPILSPILQTSLTEKHAPVMFRRKLMKCFYSHIFNLSIDPAGSHLVDAIWGGTQGMAFVRERAAEELAENETALRDNPYGRKVWKNWWMDLYKRRRGEWVKKAREVGNDGFLSFPGGVKDPENSKPKKGITHSEANAVRRNGTRGTMQRHQSFGSMNNVAERNTGSGGKGSMSSSGRLESGDYGKQKTAIELARERHMRAMAQKEKMLG